MTQLDIYVQDRGVLGFKSKFPNRKAAEEAAEKIISEGWMRKKNGTSIYYPAHRILKVEVKETA